MVGDGGWFAEPSECGPYSGPAPKGTVSSTMTVQTKGFDTTAVPVTGDLMTEAAGLSSTFSPVVINPGQSATITVTITPPSTATSGTQVQGTLYVDDTAPDVPPYLTDGADELSALPYAYTIK